MASKRDRLKTKMLARNLRVGLLGSPYDWSTVDLDSWRGEGIELCLTAFPGTREANRQDLLFHVDPSRGEKTSVDFVQNDFDVLEGTLGAGGLSGWSTQEVLDCFDTTINHLNEAILSQLKNHGQRYVGTETIIARYGTEVMRVGQLMGNSQIHIENEALAYLIEVPWRNCHELEYVIAQMVFYLDGEILKKNYVQEIVYLLGTSIRGISNSSADRTMVRSFTLDVLSRFSFQTASQLFKIQLDAFQWDSSVRDTGAAGQSRKAA